MSILSCYLLPHPPIMIEEVGGRETQKVVSSVKAANIVGKEIQELSPDTLVIISPHGPVFYDALCIYDFPLKGSLAAFGAPQVKMEFDRDDDLKNEILRRAKQNNIPVVTSGEAKVYKHGFREQLDHGVTVPMNFILKYSSDFKLLPLAFGMLTYEELYAFGKLIKESAKALGKKVVVIASGDLSHKLTTDAPAGYDPHGKLFDEKLVSILKKFDIQALLTMDSSLIEKAGECGLRSIWIMAGVLDEYKVNPEVISYEGPFGVGYCIARFRPEGRKESLLDKPYQKHCKKIDDCKRNEDPYIKLARHTLETYVKEGKIPRLPEELPEGMISSKTGVFV